MKVIYPYMIAVIAVIILSACTTLQKANKVESDAYYFSKLPTKVMKQYIRHTPEIIIRKRDGNIYYLSNWYVDSLYSFAEGNGVCLNSHLDTIQKGFMYVDLLPYDYITAQTASDLTNNFCWIIIGLEVSALVLYWWLKDKLPEIDVDW